MGLRIGTNMPSLVAQRHLGKATAALNRNFQHLSTGKRIATASDDAAGLAISARFNSQLRSVGAAFRNVNDGISLVQTAEAGLAEIGNSLVRMRELAVQSSNGTLSISDRTSLQAEFSHLQSAIDQVAMGSEFNGTNLLNGADPVTLQVGSGTVAGIDTLDISAVGVTAFSLGLGTSEISTVGAATTAMGTIDSALDTVLSVRGDFGAIQNRLSSTISSLAVRQENLAAAQSRIMDVDVAFETAQLTKNQILQQSALSILAQANSQSNGVLSLL